MVWFVWGFSRVQVGRDREKRNIRRMIDDSIYLQVLLLRRETRKSLEDSFLLNRS